MNMVAGSRKAECYTLLIYWDFTTFQPSLGFTENGPQMWKYPVSSGCVEENGFFFRFNNADVKGQSSEWADWLQTIESQ